MNRLSVKALEKLYEYGHYETAKYRYSYDYDEDKIYRIEKKMLGKTEALDPENWIEQ